jgi:hypothetical protein
VTDTFDFVVGGGPAGRTAGGFRRTPRRRWRAGSRRHRRQLRVTTPGALALMVPSKSTTGLRHAPQNSPNTYRLSAWVSKALGGRPRSMRWSYPRPPQRLRSMACSARGGRLPTRRVLQARGRQCRFRRRVSRQGRPACRQQTALPQSDPADFPAGGAGRPVPICGFQCRGHEGLGIYQVRRTAS